MPREKVAGPTKEQVEELRGFNATQKQAIRDECLNNLYFMAKGILGYDACREHVVGPLADFISYEDKKIRLSLMPRGHLKTTIATIADSVRITCKDPKNNNVLVVNEIHDNAVDIVSEILGHFENNALIQELFPECIPDKFSGPGVKWSAGRGASLPQRAGRKDPSFLAAGINTAVTSKHFNHLKLDDLAGFEANASPAAMAYAIRWVNNVQPLTMGMDETIIDFVGTRWSLNDLYSYIISLFGGNIAVFRRGMTENGKPIWPEKFSENTIEQLKKTPDVYYAQYENDPLSEASTDFDTKKIGTWRQEGDSVVYTHKGNTVRTRIRDLNRLISIDPNAGKKTSKDEAGLIVTGVDSNDCRLCLEDASDRYLPDELVDKACVLAEKWGVSAVGVEEAGQQNTEYYLRKRARKIGLFVRITPLKHNNKEKEARIRKSLQPLVADELIYLHASQTQLLRQFIEFGSGGLDDRIDAFSYHTHLVRSPIAEALRQERQSAAHKMLAMRNSMTGY